jgi:DNA-binding transcriptional ArsR family regulator
MKITAAFRALSDPTRQAMVEQLALQEMSVTVLAKPFDMSLPAVSQHLKILKEAGLAVERRVGRQRLYRLKPETLRAVSEWAERYSHFWSAKLDDLGKFLGEESHASHSSDH